MKCKVKEYESDWMKWDENWPHSLILKLMHLFKLNKNKCKRTKKVKKREGTRICKWVNYIWWKQNTLNLKLMDLLRLKKKLKRSKREGKKMPSTRTERGKGKSRWKMQEDWMESWGISFSCRKAPLKLTKEEMLMKMQRKERW